MSFRLFLQGLSHADLHQAASGEGIQKIQHIVFIIKENRSFESTISGLSPVPTASPPERFGWDLHTSDPIARRRTYDIGHSWRDRHHRHRWRQNGEI